MMMGDMKTIVSFPGPRYLEIPWSGGACCYIIANALRLAIDIAPALG
jgi:hypothetical protein